MTDQPTTPTTPTPDLADAIMARVFGYKQLPDGRWKGHGTVLPAALPLEGRGSLDTRDRLVRQMHRRGVELPKTKGMTCREVALDAIARLDADEAAAAERERKQREARQRELEVLEAERIARAQAREEAAKPPAIQSMDTERGG